MSNTVETLVSQRVASRVRAKDAALYAFSEEAQACAENFMGWTTLASEPPCSVASIQAFADEAVEQGIRHVILVSQGGSFQAPATISAFNQIGIGCDNRVAFHTLDSDSPVCVRELFASIDPAATLAIIASKSGGTIEPRLLFGVVRRHLEEALGAEATLSRLVAITDPGSALEAQATSEGWRAIFSGEPTVGGRYSALSVFGLVTAALIGIDVQRFVDRAAEAERRCAEDSADNPALDLAAFLYDAYVEGRDKLLYLAPPEGRMLCPWIEQLVAESVGKHGQGILPMIESDPLLLSCDRGDGTVVVYDTPVTYEDDRADFQEGLSCIDGAVPRRDYRFESVYDLAEHFIMWEYAVAMTGHLMQVCPFDQPDVALAKALVLDVLRDGAPEPAYTEPAFDGARPGVIEVRQSSQFADCASVRDSLVALLSSVEPGDYVAIDAFLPFVGEDRLNAMEKMRHDIAEVLGVASCVEIGPRYLHSTGQLQKGGKNNGVVLVLSADEAEDIALPAEADSLGTLAKSQATGDFLALQDRGRRVVHLHLPDNASVTLRMLAQLVCTAVAAAIIAREMGVTE